MGIGDCAQFQILHYDSKLILLNVLIILNSMKNYENKNIIENKDIKIIAKDNEGNRKEFEIRKNITIDELYNKIERQFNLEGS